MMGGDKTYTYDDQILPMLGRKDSLGGENCQVTVVIREDSVVLRVGPRDWQWDRESGRFVGAGTALTPTASKVA